MATGPRNQLIVTEDRTHTLLSHRFGVTYHSQHGAVQESRHVFLDAGLLPLLREGAERIDLLEMGFGTGLNALLVRQLSADWPDVHFHYRAIERYPIPEEEVRQLNYPELLAVETNDFHALHAVVAGETTQLSPNFTFTLHIADFLAIPAAESRSEGHPQVDLIFYDAFGPGAQPELWSVDALHRCYAQLRPGGRLVTYCAKGQFKRDLRTVGFTVEPLPGPPGKREMTRAIRPEG